MITENLVDQAFLDKYCVGYDEKTLPASAPKNGHYKAYILVKGQMAWLKRRNGPRNHWCSGRQIIKLAREIGSTKPAFISQGWGPQRHANGEIATPCYLDAGDSDR
ncbi:anaerobic dimethyl sulfoxide reductase chain A [Escherichia coli]|uniref:Anaerobic dimethyl sulfoxide reductase chain A n=1 Tax=Escherichia coli TaxID=562 RepID=A0A377AV78_ECOLX|nr:anaerobic dimethyl sulfoxide reductase chain A [Escherichia coli]